MSRGSDCSVLALTPAREASPSQEQRREAFIATLGEVAHLARREAGQPFSPPHSGRLIRQ